MASVGNVGQSVQAGPRDEMGQVPLSSVPCQTPVEEEGGTDGATPQSDFVYSHHGMASSFPLSSRTLGSGLEDGIVERVKDLVVSTLKSERVDELGMLKKEKEQAERELKLKEKELAFAESQYKLEVEKMKAEHKKELEEKDVKIKELELLNERLKDDVEKLNAKNIKLEKTIDELQEELRELNQTCIKREDLNESMHKIEERTDHQISVKIDSVVEKKVAEMLNTMCLHATAGDDNKVHEYKHHSSPSHSPSRSPVNVPNNNLNV